MEPAETLVRFEPSAPLRRAFGSVTESVPAFEQPSGAMLDLRTCSRRGEALGPFRSAYCEKSGARSFAALRVWDGPSGFLWRETREKPDSDSDYGFCATGLVASGRFCSRPSGIHIADVRLCDPSRSEAVLAQHRPPSRQIAETRRHDLQSRGAHLRPGVARGHGRQATYGEN